MVKSGQKGDFVELTVAANLRNSGCTVYFPFGNDSKADLIAEYNNKLYKIQCKYAHVTPTEDGGIDYAKFKTYSTARSGEKIPYTKNDVDFFATIVADRTYLIPIEDITSIEQRLRFSRPKNNQTKRIMYADNYIMESVLQKL
ncbi:MAG: hypothetical protein HDQ88_01285 [Clostridia bacterium]|nr:hypothetical protein [Clostridia bacterium]